MLLERPGIHPGNNIDHTPCRQLQQPAPLALDLCLCSLPPRGHSVHCSLRDPVIEPYLSLCSQDHLLSDSPFLWESSSDSHKGPQGSSRPAPMTSLLHPLLFPFPPPTQLQPARSQLLLKQTRHVTSAASTQCLLITEGFSETVEKKHSIRSSHHSLPSKNL